MYFLDRITNKSKRVALDLLFKLRFDWLFLNNKARILMFHGVAPISPRFLNHRHITPTIFEQQLIFLKKNTHIITIEEYFNKSFVRGRKNVLLTFDDGYQNNLAYALPLLEKYEIPAYFFITGLNQTNKIILWSDLHDLLASDIKTNSIATPSGVFHKISKAYKPFVKDTGENLHDYLKNVDFETKYEILYTSRVQELLSDSTFFDYWKLLTDEEIKQLDKSPFAFIGSHGFYHNNLGKLTSAEAMNELQRSKQYLETTLNKGINTLAYPDGSYNESTINIASELGFSYQLAVDYLSEDDIKSSHLCDRVGLYDFETLSMQKYKMIR